MTGDNKRHPVFRQMLTREAGTDADSSAVAAAARRLCEQLARQLTPLLGDAGVAAVYSRGLHLARRQFPERLPGHELDRNESPFARAQSFLERQESRVAPEAAAVLLTTVGKLLASFIGESLTIHILREAWPDDFPSDPPQESDT